MSPSLPRNICVLAVAPGVRASFLAVVCARTNCAPCPHFLPPPLMINLDLSASVILDDEQSTASLHVCSSAHRTRLAPTYPCEGVMNIFPLSVRSLPRAPCSPLSLAGESGL